jgi:N-dimethylarginine dimethylaminohydrolase
MRQSLLMCSPKYFGVQYIINPWMENQVGKVDMALVYQQWSEFYLTVKNLTDVKLIEPQPNVPDMVFTANAGLLRGKTFLLSRFRHGERRLEEPYFRSWFLSNGYRVVDMPGDTRFEGAGDALFQPNRDLLWSAYGFRSDYKGHEVLADVFGVKTISLHLIDARFYHLDTCFCPLMDNRVMYYPGAFDAESVKLIEANSENNIIVSDEDAGHFACNAVLADRTIIMNHASQELKTRLEQAGYSVLTVSVSEFLKAGGANKCLTMALDELPGIANFKNAA